MPDYKKVFSFLKDKNVPGLKWTLKNLAKQDKQKWQQ